MPTPLPEALRQRIVDAKKNGEGTNEELAERFMVGRASVIRAWRAYRDTGSVAHPPYRRGTKPRIDEDTLDVLKFLVRESPDATLPELADMLEHETGVAVSRQTIGRVLKLEGITRKKRR